MALNCCNTQHKPDGIYYTNHEEKGRTKVFYAKCHKCKGLVLSLYYGLFANKSDNLTGKDAKEFNRKYPQPSLTAKEEEEIKEEKSKSVVNSPLDISGSWVHGKTSEKEHKDGTIEFKHRSFYFNSGRKRANEKSTFKELQTI